MVENISYIFISVCFKSALILITIVQNMRPKQFVKLSSLKMMSTTSTALLVLCSSVPRIEAAATCLEVVGLPCTFGGCTFDTDNTGGSRKKLNSCRSSRIICCVQVLSVYH